MKILSYQPYSLFANGGGPRLLRRLYQGKEVNVFSIAVLENMHNCQKGNIEESIIPPFLNETLDKMVS